MTIRKFILFIVFSIGPFLFNSPLFAQTAPGGNVCTQVQCVKIQNGSLWVLSTDNVTYQPYFIKAVGYQPMPIGRQPNDWGYAPTDPRFTINNIYDDPDILNRDFSNLQQMNANTIRIWKGDNTTDSTGRYPDKITNAATTINVDTTQNTLDLANSYGLKVIAGFWVNFLTFDQNNNISSVDGDGNPLTRQQIINNFVTYVNNFKGNRSILFWAIGNENNYQVQNAGLISETPFENAFGITQGDAIYTWLQETANFIDLDNDIIVDLNSSATLNILMQQYPSQYSAILAILKQFSGQNLTPAQLTAWYGLVDAMAQAAHAAEGANFHPVAVVNGEIAEIGNSTDGAADSQIPDLDIWGVNVYRGQSFGTLFSNYAAQSHKPLWISEFGIDAWDTTNATGINNWGSTPNGDTGFQDQTTQSAWDVALWNEILINSPVTIGGSVMEYSDEWWKPNEWYCTSSSASQAQNTLTSAACNSTQNHFGEPSFSSPDDFTNQEWFGVMSISPNPVVGGADILSPRTIYNNLQTAWLTNPWPSITLNITGSGSGTMTSPASLGTGINCNFSSGASTGVCSTAVNENQSITLSFASSNGSTVTNWGISGCAAGAITCNVTPDTNIILNVTINTPPAPSVILSSNSFSYMSPASVYLSAYASESGSTIAKVEFYNGSTLIDTATTSTRVGPYSEFSFIWNNATPGTYSLTAKAYDSNNNAAISAPATFTISGLPTVSLTASPSAATASATITLTANASELFGTIRQVSFYNGSTLLGTASTSPYTFVWNNVPAGTYTLTAIAYDRINETTSTPVSVVVNAGTQPPVVNLVSPANNATSTAPASITLGANATSASASISKVTFFNGATLLGTVTTPAAGSNLFSFTWSNVGAGTYSLTAVATDSKGATSTSSPVTITVNASATLSPTVYLFSNSFSYSAPASVYLSAYALESGGTISRIEFYNGTTLLNTSTAVTQVGPYSEFTFIWNNPTPGNYSLTAKAYDSNNNVTVSSPAAFTINGVPTVNLTTSSSSANAPATVTLTANASEAFGSIRQVAFYNGPTLLGSVTSSPYTFVWNNVPAGNYNLTAVAFDNTNKVATSTAVNVTVTSG